MHIILHIYWHILHIGSMIYCAYSAYLLTYFEYSAYSAYHFYTNHILHILHILCTWLISVSLVVYSHYCMAPIQGPSCSLTTTYIHHHCSGFCHKKLQESPLILFACTRVSSLSHPIETVSDAINANVSHRDSENPSALCFKKSSLWVFCNIKILKIC